MSRDTLKREILAALEVRPMYTDELARSIGVSPGEAAVAVDELIREHRISAVGSDGFTIVKDAD